MEKMKLVIVADIDFEKSSWNPDAARVILDEFAKKLLLGGAWNEEVAVTLRGVMEVD